MSREKQPRKLSNLFGLLRAKTPAPTPPPAPEPPRLRVTSHVARDLLQNAAYFSAAPKAIAEYVTNAIDSAEPGQPVRCEVGLTPQEISVADNGSGMSYTELANFFQMHGENVQRKKGRTVRGKFGTGKSAAFGIADILHIETVRDGKYNEVELHRADVQAAQDGQPIHVREISVDQPTNRPPGTTIHMRSLLVEKIDDQEVRLYLEKLLGQHLRSHHIFVNGQACQYRPPEAELSFDFEPSAPLRAQIGPASCTLRVSPAALAREDNIIAVLCHGYLHATTLAGRGRSPLVEFIFGEVEVPLLDDDPGPVPAFDNTRNLSLNPQNPKVQALETWLGECLDDVLARLAEREKRRQLAREQHQLRKMAAQIKTFLEDDFLSIQGSLPWASLPGSRRHSQPDTGTGLGASNPRAKRSPSLLDRGLGWMRRLLGLQPSDPHPRLRRGEPVQFEIRYARQGPDAPRAVYALKEGVITLNRDHPQLRGAEREAGLDSRTYRMLSFDVAFTEYALVVSDYLTRRAAGREQTLDPNELAQQIIDRLGRKAAELLESETSEDE